MRPGRFVALSEDGQALVLADEVGHLLQLPIDDRVSSLLRPDRIPPSRDGIADDGSSTLAPRDIQARIRSGESAEDVARMHLLAFEKGALGKRYIACGEVATFPQVLSKFNALWGASPEIEVLPPGSDIPREKLWGHAIRSEAYGKLGPMRIDDAQARALGFAPKGLDEGLGETVEWLRREGKV